jgi:hypothetical protein
MNNRRGTLINLSTAGVILAGIVFLLGNASIAKADACTDPSPAGLSGTIVGAECQVHSSVIAQGTYNLAQTLHICSPAGTCATPNVGTITVPPVAGGNNLTLHITGGLIMDDGARSSATPAQPAASANISITASAAFSGRSLRRADHLHQGAAPAWRTAATSRSTPAQASTLNGSVIRPAIQPVEGERLRSALPGGKSG